MNEGKVTIETGFNLENTYANLPEMFFTKKGPSHVKAPSLVKLNSSLAKELGLNIDALQSNEGVEILSGNKIPEGSIPLAQAYAGHQFGHFTLLGDGRALLLGEHITPKGERVDIQLKGSGRTPYSRGGDGKAALGPMLREYIISEAMHALNIPTTRSLAVTKTGEAVIRETYLKGAVLTRIASSHIRVGTFQYARNWGTAEDIKKLADYTLKRHYKEIENEENPYLSLLKEVIKRQAELIAKWQLVGFIHGVMNTDNMTISGETIDYGPCAFMDIYDPETVFSSIDIYGRYAYKNQPNMAVWNLARFAETLLPLLNTDQDEAVKLAEDALSDFSEIFKNNWISGMRAKLGIFNEEASDEELIKNLLNIMKKHKADYTNTFRALTIGDLNGLEIFNSEEFKEWYKIWQERLSRQDESKDLSKKLMKSSNPAVIPRNHRVEEALEAAEKGDYNVMDKLLDVLINPFEYSKAQEEYTKLPKPSSCKYKTYCGT
ncbi:selenoprotein O and cysteine-containing homologs [Clostridium baratii]|uniref:protein adenylyltransferase SelO n=1 Tax=Clostridium baratii TaxID=1561 RepID=UPI0006C1B722|nr:YdiU family protein [Clostridium baratii]CUO85852.1 selenoprotein O and cysteine-containing homologs [Clostridium baratii]